MGTIDTSEKGLEALIVEALTVQTTATATGVADWTAIGAAEAGGAVARSSGLLK